MGTLRIVNTGKLAVRVFDSERYRADVHPAWLIVGDFGRVRSAFEKTGLGSDPGDDVRQALRVARDPKYPSIVSDTPKRYRRAYVKLGWIRYV